jgi:glycosyltransferase involved in cell wall biosynthesis
LRFHQLTLQQLGFCSKILLFFLAKPQPDERVNSSASSALLQPSKAKVLLFTLFLKWGAWIFSPRLFFHILQSTYDVIHATPFPHTHIYYTIRAASLAGIPIVLTPAYHVEVQGGMAWQLQLLASMVNKLAVFTEKELADLEKLGIPKNKMAVISPGLIPPADEGLISASRFRTTHKLGDNPVVLFAGTKSFDKGFHHVVEAMVLVNKVLPKAVLVAIGQGDAALHDEIIRKLPNAINLGYLREDKWDAFAACDVFVMPSRCDSFGLVYTEAWLSGKPVIGANCGSTPYVIRDGVDGKLVPFGDVGTLANTIVMLFNDKQQRNQLGEAGRQYTLQNYIAPSVVKKLEAVYKSLL